MLDYFINYAGANLVCFIIFGIMLARDLLNVDRQEKQIKFNHSLIAFMLYFVSDSAWAAVIAEIIPKTRFTVLLTNFLNYIILAMITYTWLHYVMAVEQIANRDRRLHKFVTMFPLIVSTVAMFVIYIHSPEALIDEALKPMPISTALLSIVPIIYIVAVLFYALRKVKNEVNRQEKRRHLYIGFFPLILILGGMLQIMLLPKTPIFCFSCVILMLIFYIQQMEMRISIDPLTKLNNRGQLLLYTSQEFGSNKEDKKTVVMMIDINDFKKINDTFGHAEGDRALIILSDALRNATKNITFRTFIGRYGGDEFVLIAHPTEGSELVTLIDDIRTQIKELCEKNETKYVLSVGIGYDELIGGQDTFQKCLQRADKKLYIDKEHMKMNGETTVCN